MLIMNIGQAAAAAGVTPKMIRHYESLGLVPDVQRTDAGYRLYSQREVRMLRFIRQSRSLGFSVKQIESLLELWRDDGRASREVKQLAEEHLAALDERQRELDDMRATLSALVTRCAGDDGPHCAILDELGADAPAAPAGARPASSSLKQVRAGSKLPRARSPAAGGDGAPGADAHSALAAWSRGLGPR